MWMESLGDQRRARSITSVDDARYLAQRRIPRLVADFVRGGTGPRSTLAGNTEAFERITFRPRVGVRHPVRDLSTSVLGHRIAVPVMIAPTGGPRLVHPDGERAGAIAASAAGTIQWVSTFSGTPIEEITAAAAGPVFFQLYYPGSRAAAESLIERAASAGCAAIVLTLDSGSPPRPEVPIRGRVTVYRGATPGMRPPIEWLRIARSFATKPSWTARFAADRAAGLRAAMVDDGDRAALLFRASHLLTRETPVWADIGWIKERWAGPVIAKGILTAEDARAAVAAGADAIVVSNHGGNMLDGDPPTISVLPEIVAAVGDRVEVFLDSGIRRGSDVVKAIALGARAVLIGRSWLWGLGAAGTAGVEAVLEAYRGQIESTLGGLGLASTAELGPDCVRTPSEWGARTG
jgi:isopentenyl diphosphate isomerase/L-lactate dehydrogenase-like FMN-dependent dehydrogenase